MAMHEGATRVLGIYSLCTSRVIRVFGIEQVLFRFGFGWLGIKFDTSVFWYKGMKFFIRRKSFEQVKIMKRGIVLRRLQNRDDG